jgi:hypothetical protein
MQNLNQMAGRNVILQHAITEHFRTNSGYISECLHQDYRKAIQLVTEESVVRQVIPTNNFALGSSVSDEQISEQH